MNRSRLTFILFNIFFIGTTAQAFYAESLGVNLGKKFTVPDVRKISTKLKLPWLQKTTSTPIHIAPETIIERTPRLLHLTHPAFKKTQDISTFYKPMSQRRFYTTVVEESQKSEQVISQKTDKDVTFIDGTEDWRKLWPEVQNNCLETMRKYDAILKEQGKSTHLAVYADNFEITGNRLIKYEPRSAAKNDRELMEAVSHSEYNLIHEIDKVRFQLPKPQAQDFRRGIQQFYKLLDYRYAQL